MFNFDDFLDLLKAMFIVFFIAFCVLSFFVFADFIFKMFNIEIFTKCICNCSK